MANIGDVGPRGGVCVDIIHTDGLGDIEIYSDEKSLLRKQEADNSEEVTK